MTSGGVHAPAPPTSPPLPDVDGRPWPASPPTWHDLEPPSPLEPTPEHRPLGLLVWTSVIAATALLATVLALALTGGRQGDGTGRFEATVDDPGRVLGFEVRMERGDVLEVHLEPGATLDVAFAYAVEPDVAAADWATLTQRTEPLQDYLDGLAAFDELFGPTASEHGWFVLYSTDAEETGVDEVDLLLAGADGTYRVLVRGAAGTTGDVVVDLERTRRDDLLEDRALFDEATSGSRLSYDWYLARFG